MSQCSSYKEGWEFELCLSGISPNIERLSERDRQPRIWQARISLDLCMTLFEAVVIVLGWGDASPKDGKARISGSLFLFFLSLSSFSVIPAVSICSSI